MTPFNKDGCVASRRTASTYRILTILKNTLDFESDIVYSFESRSERQSEWTLFLFRSSVTPDGRHFRGHSQFKTQLRTNFSKFRDNETLIKLSFVYFFLKQLLTYGAVSKPKKHNIFRILCHGQFTKYFTSRTTHKIRYVTDNAQKYFTSRTMHKQLYATENAQNTCNINNCLFMANRR